MAGAHIPALFDTPADSLVTGREERGAPVVNYDLDIAESGDCEEIMMSWRG